MRRRLLIRAGVQAEREAEIRAHRLAMAGLARQRHVSARASHQTTAAALSDADGTCRAVRQRTRYRSPGTRLVARFSLRSERRHGERASACRPARSRAGRCRSSSGLLRRSGGCGRWGAPRRVELDRRTALGAISWPQPTPPASRAIPRRSVFLPRSSDSPRPIPRPAPGRTGRSGRPSRPSRSART